MRYSEDIYTFTLFISSFSSLFFFTHNQYVRFQVIQVVIIDFSDGALNMGKSYFYTGVIKIHICIHKYIYVYHLLSITSQCDVYYCIIITFPRCDI
jgi:hypothetical protein